jgi:hypothetical protein
LLNRLIINLPNTLELSSEEGYMRNVIERFPNWSRQVTALHQANLDCVSALSLVRDRLEEEGETDIVSISQGLEIRLQKWLESFMTMRCSENTIVQKAFTLDLGGEA